MRAWDLARVEVEVVGLVVVVGRAELERMELESGAPVMLPSRDRFGMGELETEAEEVGAALPVVKEEEEKGLR